MHYCLYYKKNKIQKSSVTQVLKNGLLISALLTSSIFASALLTGSVFAKDITNDIAKDTDSEHGLKTALHAALKYHPALKGKNAELLAQYYSIEQAKASYYPTLSTQIRDFNDAEKRGTIGLKQPLYTFGKIETNIKQQQAAYQVEEWGVLQVQRTLVEDTAAAYAKIIANREQLQIAQTNVAEHQKLYRRIKRRQLGQLASVSDVRFAHSRVIQAKTQRQRISGELQVALTELRSLTQLTVSSEQSVRLTLVDLPEQSIIYNQAMKSSAEVGIKRQRINVVKLEVKKTRLSLAPTISLQLNQDFWGEKLAERDTRIGLVIEGNLEGLGLANYAKVEGGSARLLAAKHDMMTAEIDFRQRIESLWLNRQVQNELKKAQKQSVAAVEQTVASFIRQYDTGRKSWVEVLNTQRELFSLKLSLVETERDWMISSLRIASLSGRLDTLAGINFKGNSAL